jgi:hypothetical protein
MKTDMKASGPELKRADTYTVAEKLSCDLSNLSQTVNDTVQMLNGSSETQVCSRFLKAARFISLLQAFGQNPSDPMAAIIKILNIHVSTLKHIDSEITSLDRKLQSLQRLQQKIAPELTA